MTQLRQVGLRGGEERAPAILVTGQPQEFRELVARSLGVPVDNVVHVYSCPATEEFMMQAGSTVDVIIVSPEVRLGDVMPMVEFLHSSYPGTPIVLLHDPRKSEVAPPSHPGIVAVVDIGEGPEGLRQAVLGTVSSA